MNYHHFGYKQESLKKAIAQHQHVKQRILWGGWGGGDGKKVIDKGLGTRLL